MEASATRQDRLNTHLGAATPASGWTKHDNVMHSSAAGNEVDTGDADDVDLLLGLVVAVQLSVIEDLSFA